MKNIQSPKPNITLTHQEQIMTQRTKTLDTILEAIATQSADLSDENTIAMVDTLIKTGYVQQDAAGVLRLTLAGMIANMRQVFAAAETRPAPRSTLLNRFIALFF